MHPILFKIPLLGGLTIFTYGALVASGFLAGIIYITREARRVGEDTGKVLDLLFWVIVAAIIGSRVYYVLVVEPGTILGDPVSFFKIWKGGLVFQGGVIGAFVVGIWYIKKHKLPVWKYLDIFAPAIPLGHFFGRIGCLMSGCCHGRAVDAAHWWTVTFPADPSSFAPAGIPMFPTQLMEAFGELLIFAALFLFRKHKKFNGQLMAIYMMTYPVLRFIVEYFRDASNRNMLFDSFSVAQLVSVVMIAFGAWIWVRNSRKERIV